MILHQKVIQNITGVSILKSIYKNENLPCINNSKVVDISLYDNGTQLDIKLIFDVQPKTFPKQWEKYDYSSIGIVLRCINIRYAHVDINKPSTEKYNFEIEIIDGFSRKINMLSESNSIEVLAESICFDKPFGVLPETTESPRVRIQPTTF